MNTGGQSRGGKKGATSVCYIVPERFALESVRFDRGGGGGGEGDPRSFDRSSETEVFPPINFFLEERYNCSNTMEIIVNSIYLQFLS